MTTPATPSRHGPDGLRLLLRRFARNRAAVFGMALLLIVCAMAASAPWLFPRNPLHIVGPPELWPLQDPRFPLGTDAIGRNIAALIFHGARTALAIGVVASLVSCMIGVGVGALAGYFGGWLDDVLMRVTEMFQTIPNLVFVLAIVSVLGADIVTVVLAIGAVSWTSMARIVRAEFLSFRDQEFVAAARTVGMSNARIILSEILPNALPSVIVYASFLVAAAILFEAALAFLGLSDPTIASWGRMVGEGRMTLRSSWHIAAIPGVAILLTVLALNLIGDGLNDILNPRLRQ